jgi:hypothetical protein
MWPGTTAAARSHDVDAEAGLCAVGSVSAAIVRHEQLDVFVALPPIHVALDVVGEVDLALEVRQYVLARPIADLVVVAARPGVAV